MRYTVVRVYIVVVFLSVHLYVWCLRFIWN